MIQDAHNYGAWAKLYAIYGERYTFSREVVGRSADGRQTYKCVLNCYLYLSNCKSHSK